MGKGALWWLPLLLVSVEGQRAQQQLAGGVTTRRCLQNLGMLPLAVLQVANYVFDQASGNKCVHVHLR